MYQPLEYIDAFARTPMAGPQIITLRNVAMQNMGMQVIPNESAMTSDQSAAAAALAYIQQQILDIIEAVTIQMKFEDIFQMAVRLEEYIDKKVEITRILDNIEQTVTSIIGNVTQRIDLGIVIKRITYLRELIAKIAEADPTFEYSYDNSVSTLLFDIIQCITDEFNPEKLKAVILDMQANMEAQCALFYENTELIKTIRDCEPIIISIIENITNRVDLNLVLNRIYYLQELIKNCRY